MLISAKLHRGFAKRRALNIIFVHIWMVFHGVIRKFFYIFSLLAFLLLFLEPTFPLPRDIVYLFRKVNPILDGHEIWMYSLLNSRAGNQTT